MYAGKVLQTFVDRHTNKVHRRDSIYMSDDLARMEELAQAGHIRFAAPAVPAPLEPPAATGPDAGQQTAAPDANQQSTPDAAAADAEAGDPDKQADDADAKADAKAAEKEKATKKKG